MKDYEKSSSLIDCSSCCPHGQKKIWDIWLWEFILWYRYGTVFVLFSSVNTFHFSDENTSVNINANFLFISIPPTCTNAFFLFKTELVFTTLIVYQFISVIELSKTTVWYDRNMLSCSKHCFCMRVEWWAEVSWFWSCTCVWYPS